MTEFKTIKTHLKRAFNYDLLVTSNSLPTKFKTDDYVFQISKSFRDGRMDFEIEDIFSIKEGVKITVTVDLMRQLQDILIHHKTVK